MSPSSRLQSSVTWSHELPPVQASTTPVMFRCASRPAALLAVSLACLQNRRLRSVPLSCNFHVLTAQAFLWLEQTPISM